MGKIPTTIITGFLGAGKTTIIRNLLAARPGQKFALIVNEFGDIGMDGEILRGCGIENCDDTDLVELANGCICCTVAEEFRPAMETILDREPQPDHIVIETSGLALPQPLVRAFNWPAISTRVTVDGVIAVVDGPAAVRGTFAHDPVAVQEQRLADDSLDHDSPLSELFEDQLACADLVVINKAGDIAGESISRLETELGSRVRNGVGMVTTRDGAIDPRLLVGLDLAAESTLESRQEIHHLHDEGASDESSHGHDEFESISLEIPEIDDVPGFLGRLERVIRDHDLLRVKGIAAVRNKPMRLVIQAAGPRLDSYFDRPPANGQDRSGRLVVISLAGIDQAAISAVLLDGSI